MRIVGGVLISVPYVANRSEAAVINAYFASATLNISVQSAYYCFLFVYFCRNMIFDSYSALRLTTHAL